MGPSPMSFSCSELRLEVPALRGQLIGAHHRQRDVVTDPGIFLGREQVRGRRAEELDRRVVERWRVRHVDDHLGARENLGQSLARERVHTGRRRRGDGVVTVFGQGVHQLRANEAGSSDDDDSHDEPFLVVTCS